jgi:iron complex transport system ATP-binding protein
MLKQGNLWDIGTPAAVLTPENLAQVFGVEVIVLQTPVGVQICPIAPFVVES